jgi:hypothetical protein
MGAVAAVTVVAAHSFAYLLVTPDPHAREELLSATGHARWTLVIALAVGVFVAGLVHFATAKVWAGGDPQHDVPGAYRYAVPRLALLQIGAFMLLEALERAATGHSVSHLLSEPAFILGIVLQGLAAFLSALVLLLIERVVGILKGTRRMSRRASTPPPPFNSEPLRLRARPGSGATTLRGPPQPLRL